MLSYDEFKSEVEAVVKDYLPDEYKDAKVTIATVSKIGITYDSLTVRKEGQLAAPAANLNAFYKEYEEGKEFDEVMDDVAEVLQTKAPDHLQNASWLLDYENAKKQLFIRVSSIEKNVELINNAPHRIVGDLVITCHIAVDRGLNGMASTIVNNDLLNHYGVEAETVLSDAIENAPVLLPVKIESMMDVISGMCPEVISEDMKKDPNFSDHRKMTIVSNSKMINGASALFYPGVMDQLSDLLGGDYVILPSSIHEFIVVPDRGNYSDLENMVRDINQNMVDPQEQLSDHVYHYDSVEKLFESCEEYTARLEQNVDTDNGPDVDDDIDI